MLLQASLAVRCGSRGSLNSQIGEKSFKLLSRVRERLFVSAAVSLPAALTNAGIKGEPPRRKIFKRT